MEGRELKLHRLTADKKLQKVRWSPPTHLICAYRKIYRVGTEHAWHDKVVATQNTRNANLPESDLL